MANCRFLTPCGICEIKSMSGIPYMCDLQRKVVDYKTYTDKDCEKKPEAKNG